MKNLLLVLLVIFTASSCGEDKLKNEEKVFNSGDVIVKDGKGNNDTIPFKCTGCEENLTELDFKRVIDESVDLTKETMKYPRSFIPTKLDITLIKEDSLFWFDSSEKIDSVITVIAESNFIAKNGYGNELEGDGVISFTIVDGVIRDISEDIKLPELNFEKGYINRSLSASHNDKFIKITPTKEGMISAVSNISCVDENAILAILLEGTDENVTITSWNDFNCDGIMLFDGFDKNDIELLKTHQVNGVGVITDGERTSVSIPKNKKTYFKELFTLIQ